MGNDIEKQLEIIGKGAVDLITEQELSEKLREGRPLRVKYGADPSAPDLHLGHAVQLRALRDLQELGHEIIFIIGDFTAMLGDPSGQSKTRPQLSRAEVEKNAQTYADQASQLLDLSRAKLLFNSEWLDKLNLEEVIKLAGKHTVARMLERDDFAKRYVDQQAIGLHEFLYPLLQAYDSVAIEADLELGGTDQKFNLLLGREIQREYGQPQQIVITRPLIPGTDGVQKMSKSLGNYVAINDPPREMYGKLMSLPDPLMVLYFELLTDLSAEEIQGIKAGLEDGSLHPKEAKQRLAWTITSDYHGREAANQAQAEFDATFVAGGPDEKTAAAVAEPVEIAKSEVAEPLWITRALVLSGLAKSNSEARRLVQQGAVVINGEKITDPESEITLTDGTLLRVGKRKIARVSLK